MDFNFKEDLKIIREILALTQQELADKIQVDQKTIARNETGEVKPSKNTLEKVYSFAFENRIQLNKLKELFWIDNIKDNHKILFHGAKKFLEGDIDINKGKLNNDFGQGFYAGESFEQSVSFVADFNESAVYILDFDNKNLKHKKYKVDQQWMMTIAYYRGNLRKYQNHPIIQNLISESRDCDYIIAPIADNRMFQIIDSFVEGEITDEQCKHSLSATQLGNQYVFISQKAIEQVNILEKCYLSSNEKEYYKNVKSEHVELGDNKVKMAKIKYRGKGKYIDEILR
ncbi:MAG: DUF3990 domain-containing protein [Erysipelotrichia bacterium]|nr:DUF3990 domain-containing protein [Erysipelotrichia bacterium]